MAGRDGWSLQVASDVIRDGLALELLDDQGRMRAEVFRCDADHTVTVTHFDAEPIPPQILVWYHTEAARELDPFEDGSPLPERSAWRSPNSR
jgi:hypothetical protein